MPNPNQDPLSHREPAEMHICKDGCGCDLVQPVNWSPVDNETDGVRSQWWVELRCPNCEGVSSGVFNQEDIENFDEELEVGKAILEDSLVEMLRVEMEDEIGVFVTALSADAILPEDF